MFVKVILKRKVQFAGIFVFGLAFFLRWLTVLIFPSIHYADEIFQAVEPAHRLVFGYGLETWEWMYGMRSWLFPGLIAGVMEVSRLFGGGPAIYMPMIGALLAALGAASALCAFLWGNRLYGLWSGILAGIWVAVWVDAVYFGPRPLLDAVSAHLMVIGLYFLIPGKIENRFHRIAIAGFLLSIAVLFRIQLALAVMCLVFIPWKNQIAVRKRFLPFAVGSIAALIVYGGVDAATLDYPFESLWRHVTINLGLHVSQYFGSGAGSYYIETLLSRWTPEVSVSLVLLALLGVRQLPQILFSALIILFTLTLIEHKEWRFLYPAVLLFVISAGLGLARLCYILIEKGTSWKIASALLFLPIILIFAVSYPICYSQLWVSNVAITRVSKVVSSLKEVCGIAFYGMGWSSSGGYSLIHQPVPLYWIIDTNFITQRAPFNTVISRMPLPRHSIYHVVACFGKACVWQRSGACAVQSMAALLIPPNLETVSQVKRRL